MPRLRILLYLGAIVVLLALVVTWYAVAFVREAAAPESSFDGLRALSDVQRQVDFGPRTPGSEAHEQAIEWMQAELGGAGWTVRRQVTASMGQPITNLIAFRTAEAPQVLVGAHYDTRLLADRDPQLELRSLPGPGANDGGSGVAVLLELARTLPIDTVPIWLVFFDAEDNGRIPGWDWILGSNAFVAEMSVRPEKMVLVDMVGDSDLQIPMERNSDADLRASIWETAARLGHGDVFLPQVGKPIVDDHVPFLEAGIPAVDIIDLDYEYWHTTGDTPDKLSAGSLQIVGDVLWTWLIEQSASSEASGP
ncbi:MAG: M28 family peptidase [Chloroflexota bacterium]